MLCVKHIFIVTAAVLMLINRCYANATDDWKQDAKCLLPMEPGPCRMSLTRFYYNAKTDSCEEFKFGGCKGNDNKFGFKQTCEAACKKSPATSTPKAMMATSKGSTTTEKNSLLVTTTVKTLTTATHLPDIAHTTVKTKASISTTPSGSRMTTTQKSNRY